MKKYNKYKNIRVEIDGFKFASKKEGRRYVELKLLELAGKITVLELQPSFALLGADGRKLYTRGPKKISYLKYVADFRYFDVELNKTVIEDVKGFITKEYKIKRAIMQGMGINIREI